MKTVEERLEALELENRSLEDALRGTVAQFITLSCQVLALKYAVGKTRGLHRGSFNKSVESAYATFMTAALERGETLAEPLQPGAPTPK